MTKVGTEGRIVTDTYDLQCYPSGMTSKSKAWGITAKTLLGAGCGVSVMIFFAKVSSLYNTGWQPPGYHSYIASGAIAGTAVIIRESLEYQFPSLKESYVFTAVIASAGASSVVVGITKCFIIP